MQSKSTSPAEALLQIESWIDYYVFRRGIRPTKMAIRVPLGPRGHDIIYPMNLTIEQVKSGTLP